MKICAISDTHLLGHRMKHKIEPADILIHAGDILSRGNSIEELAQFCNWFKPISQDFQFIIMVNGNHDKLFETNKKLAKEELYSRISNIALLENQGCEIGDIKFYGSPITPTYGAWSFMVDRGEAIQKYWDNIPHDTNILISHGPPFAILDEVLYPKGHHAGCENMRHTLTRLCQLKAHIFGHLHLQGGQTMTEDFGHGPVSFINAAICDDDYIPSRKPIVFEIDKEKNIILS